MIIYNTAILSSGGADQTNEIYDFSKWLYFLLGTCKGSISPLQFACLLVDIIHGKFLARSGGHQRAAGSTSYTTVQKECDVVRNFLNLCEMCNDETAHVYLSDICARTVVAEQHLRTILQLERTEWNSLESIHQFLCMSKKTAYVCKLSFSA